MFVGTVRRIESDMGDAGQGVLMTKLIPASEVVEFRPVAEPVHELLTQRPLDTSAGFVVCIWESVDTHGPAFTVTNPFGRIQHSNQISDRGGSSVEQMVRHRQPGRSCFSP